MRDKILMFSVLCSMMFIASCAEKRSTRTVAEAKAADEIQEQPISVSRKNDSASELAPSESHAALAPVPAAPLAVPTATVPATNYPEPVPMPVPVPVPLVHADECDEDGFCGDGRRDDGEECDDGDSDNGDRCDNLCRKVRCGNGRVEGDEECDAETRDSCTEECKLVSCVEVLFPFDDPETEKIDGPRLCLQAPFPGALEAVDLDAMVLTVLDNCPHRVGDLINMVLSGEMDTYRAEVTLPAGEVATAHYHPGLLFVEVFEGEVVHTDSVIENGELVFHSKTFKAGESFFETPFVVTDVANNTSKTARFAVSIINVKGEQPIIPSEFPTTLPTCP